MAYATVDQLAAALRIRLTPENTDALQACLDAAAEEIDHAIDASETVPIDDPLVSRVNILRGVEWFKANDAAFGFVGFDQIGALQMPRSTFARHRMTLLPVMQGFGIA
jgi:hypothetical protein